MMENERLKVSCAKLRPILGKLRQVDKTFKVISSYIVRKRRRNKAGNPPGKVAQAYNPIRGSLGQKNQKFEASISYIDTLRPIYTTYKDSHQHGFGWEWSGSK